MTRLSAMLAGIEGAIHAPAPQREVAAILAAYANCPDLLRDERLPAPTDRYARHCLADCPQAGFAVAALIWEPGQMSRVHSHRAWCALAVHVGVLTEMFYQIEPDPEPCGCALRRAGDISYAPAGLVGAHRIANLGTRPAISIHVYGTEFANFAGGLNVIHAA